MRRAWGCLGRLELKGDGEREEKMREMMAMVIRRFGGSNLQFQQEEMNKEEKGGIPSRWNDRNELGVGRPNGYKNKVFMKKSKMHI